jgi:protein involved in polysaccharide export with SLBB domain
MRGPLLVFCWVLVVGVLALAGCTSNSDLMLSRLLAELDTEPEQVTTDPEALPDSPEAPVAALPPPEAIGKGPVDRALVIQPDSLVQIRVEEDPALDGSYAVNSIGAIPLGYVGPVVVFNMSEKEAADKIESILKSRDFRKATVKVQIMRPSYDRIRVTGLVNKPGLVKIGAGDRIPLNNALLGAGGLSTSARSAQVRIVRNGLQSPVALSLEGELYPLVDDEGTPKVPEVFVQNNDVIHVLSVTQGKKGGTKIRPPIRDVLVLGEVKREGIYRFKSGEPATILYLILKMGGLPPYANKKSIRILRMDEEGFESEIRVNAAPLLEEGNPEDDVELENGDRVVVPARTISLF